mgnify:CR=1 FL=1
MSGHDCGGCELEGRRDFLPAAASLPATFVALGAAPAVAEAMTGWAHAEALGRPLAEVFRILDETTRRPVEDPVARVLRENAVIGLANHTLLISRDGRESTANE